MDIVEEWRPVCQQVIYRALCDALGFTNLPHDKEEHRRCVNEARAWFIEAQDEYRDICDIAGMDAVIVRQTATQLIYARSSGDHTKVPPFWREVFQRKRIPNLTNIERAIANVRRVR
jgi:hypothetical protein